MLSLVYYNLIGFVDGTNTCPTSNHQDYNYWIRQDQLIIHVIITYVDSTVITILGNVKNSTRSVVPLPKGQNIIGCKWLFRVKRNLNGLVARYKACLVAKGFMQCPEIDFKETFAPIVRPQTIKIILTLTFGNNC